jgi:hypothetical protein
MERKCTIIRPTCISKDIQLQEWNEIRSPTSHYSQSPSTHSGLRTMDAETPQPSPWLRLIVVFYPIFCVHLVLHDGSNLRGCERRSNLEDKFASEIMVGCILRIIAKELRTDDLCAAMSKSSELRADYA